MKPIIRNRDDKGRILTYTVDFGAYALEFNDLKTAKLMACDDASELKRKTAKSRTLEELRRKGIL